MSRPRPKSRKHVAAGRIGGSVCGPAKRAAAKRRAGFASLKSLITWLSNEPDLLSHPELRPAIDELTQVLLMRAARRLLETGRV